jgi:hypothetical protein
MGAVEVEWDGSVAKKPIRSASKQYARKRRTRQHIIADLALVDVQYYIANAGFTSEVKTKDYGYDLTVNTFDGDGLIEPGAILIQLKASETLEIHPDGVSYVFDLDVRDYNLWVMEPNPVLLILYEAKSRRAYWLYFQQFLKEHEAPRPRAGAKTVRIRIPIAHRVRTAFFRHARRLKEQRLKQWVGADPHG